MSNEPNRSIWKRIFPPAEALPWPVWFLVTVLLTVAGAWATSSLFGDDSSLAVAATTTIESVTSSTASTTSSTAPADSSTTTTETEVTTTSSTTTTVPNPVTVQLDTLDPIEGSWQSNLTSANINGQTYTHSLGDCSSEVFEFDLSRDYSFFSATVGVSDSAPSETVYVFDVYVDDELKFSDTFSIGKATPLEIDVTNGLRLSLRMERQVYGGSGSCFVIGNASITGLGDQVGVTQPDDIFSAVFLDSLDAIEGTWPSAITTANINGTTYTHNIGDCSNEEFEFDLSRDYTFFRATVGVSDFAPSGTAFTFEVFVDDEFAFSDSFVVGKASGIDLSVTDALRLRLVLNREEYGGSGSCFIVGEARLIADQ